MNSIPDEFAYDNVDIFYLIFFVGGVNYLLFGLASTLISGLINNPSIGIIAVLSYGLVWMSQYTNYARLLINPFSYSAGNSEPYIYKAVNLLMVALLFVMNYGYIKNRFLCMGI